MQLTFDVLLARIVEFTLSWGGGLGGDPSAKAVHYSRQKSWHLYILYVFVCLETVYYSKGKS